MGETIRTGQSDVPLVIWQKRNKKCSVVILTGHVMWHPAGIPELAQDRLSSDVQRPQKFWELKKQSSGKKSRRKKNQHIQVYFKTLKVKPQASPQGCHDDMFQEIPWVSPTTLSPYSYPLHMLKY